MNCALTVGAWLYSGNAVRAQFIAPHADIYESESGLLDEG
jgi:hypothetical protein